MMVPQIDARDARRAVDEQDALLVDVRESNEWGDARIPGALHVPLSEFQARVGDLPKDRPLILYCASGARSNAAAGFLLGQGFPDVVNLAPGIAGWQAAGLPIER